MSKLMTTTALLMTLVMAPAAYAAGPNNQADVNGNVAEQQQIEQGLKSGQLSTGEAARLEKGEARIERTEANADKNGSISPAEQAKIQKEQSQENLAIQKAESNGVKGNPNSVSDKRMQADVQRNVNQETRIQRGTDSGALTNKEVGKLERGQAHVDRAEYRAGRNGRINGTEQARIQRKENRQSGRIFRKKHNEVTAPAAQ
ncbi:MAG: hypothetical protein M3N08_09725 [Pseudomonadota bacterium]|nr:hypothetical protein [Pseudomonadota bacterium]